MLTIDVLRQRDQARFTGTAAMAANAVPLTGGSDYLTEGVRSFLVIGGSWTEVVNLAARADRIAIWNRAISEADVLALFNGGAGWMPG